MMLNEHNIHFPSADRRSISPRKIWFTLGNNITLSEQEHNEKTKENRRQTESVPPHYLMIDTHRTTAKLNETKEQKKTNVYHTVEHLKSAIERVSTQVEPLCNVLGCY